MEPPKQLKFDPPLWRQRQDFIVNALLERGCRRVLDLGCGSGELLERLRPLMEHVVGLELSESRCRAARQRGVEVLQGDLLEKQWHERCEKVEAVVLCEASVEMEV